MSPPPTPTTHTTKHGRKSTGRGPQGTDDDIEVASAGYGDVRRGERGEAQTIEGPGGAPINPPTKPTGVSPGRMTVVAGAGAPSAERWRGPVWL